MLIPTRLAQAVALALLIPAAAHAEFEISGAAKLEYSVFAKDGQMTGAPEEHDQLDVLKSEPSVKLFLNSPVGEDSAFHAELLLADDGEAASDRLEGGESYTQYEVLREFYFDVPAAGWDFRLGKQQVVWGTADGIKLLDIINPTDFRELNQNVSEDSRIPVWMINAEKYLDNGGDIQIILSEAQPNVIAGLDEDGDPGAPFIFKGVDTITGASNGFLHIAPDMGQTSGIFQNLLQLGGLTGLVGGPMSFTTVEQFTNLTQASYDGLATNLIGGGAVVNNAPPGFPNKSLLNAVFVPMMTGLGDGNNVLNAAANNGEGLFSGFLGFMMGDGTTGNIPGTSNPALLTQAMGVPTFASASEAQQDAVIASSALLSAMGLMNPGADMTPGTADDAPWDLTDDTQRGAFTTMMMSLTPEQQQQMMQTPQIQGMQAAFGSGTTNQFSGTLNTDDPQSAFDFMGNTTFATFNNFIGMQTEYRKNYDTDPFSEQNLGFRYRNSTEGGTNYSINYAYRMDSNPSVDIHWEDGAGNELGVAKTASTLDATTGAVVNPGTLGETTTASSGTAGTYDVTTINLLNPDNSAFDSQGGQNPATLVFEENQNRISTIGASFDTALDTSIPMIIRGEFSLDVGTKQPVINLDELSIGNLTGALKMEDADMFKYVLGVDVTVLTNLLVSTQLIQFYNLDYIDDGNRYTGDFTSMSLTNGMKKGDEIETFISLFFSKPFGSDVQHRWNNILIVENDGGYWNRFDVEYSFNNNLVGTVEYNKYWGDEDTMFGQFEDTSNLQFGIKYIF